jgi:signal transduction histidine kinase
MAICCLTQLYQVVTRLQYDEQERDVFESAFGYTVNRDWVTRSYFSEIASQVSGIGNTGENLDLAILDERGQPITGQGTRLPATSRYFPLLFVDAASIAVDPPPDLTVRRWEVQVSTARDPTLAWATRSADWTLLHIVRVNARLAEMKADFVSTVTHELRTPAGDHSRRRRHAGAPPRDRPRSGERVRADAGAGGQAADEAGGQPAGLRAGHRHH